MFSWRSGPKF
ncbi:hypothetical protein LINPERHAP2_LOCUS36214 [Linum perenne]